MKTKKLTANKVRCAACAKCDWRDGLGRAEISALCEACLAECKAETI